MPALPRLPHLGAALTVAVTYDALPAFMESSRVRAPKYHRRGRLRRRQPRPRPRPRVDRLSGRARGPYGSSGRSSFRRGSTSSSPRYNAQDSRAAVVGVCRLHRTNGESATIRSSARANTWTRTSHLAAMTRACHTCLSRASHAPSSQAARGSSLRPRRRLLCSWSGWERPDRWESDELQSAG